MTVLEQRLPSEFGDLTDAEKLETLAVWFDLYDKEPMTAAKLLAEAGDESADPDEVQQDLRRIAAHLRSEKS